MYMCHAMLVLLWVLVYVPGERACCDGRLRLGVVGRLAGGGGLAEESPHVTCAVIPC